MPTVRCQKCNLGFTVDALPVQFVCPDCGTINHVNEGKVYADKELRRGCVNSGWPKP